MPPDIIAFSLFHASVSATSPSACRQHSRRHVAESRWRRQLARHAVNARYGRFGECCAMLSEFARDASAFARDAASGGSLSLILMTLMPFIIFITPLFRY